MPVGRWFRGELKDYLRDSLLSKASLGRGYFDPDKVRLMVDSHIEGRRDLSFQLWAMLMLELWHKKFIDERTVC
jgi:asparagine synthase (glutamine-hydrolysing)